MTTSQLRSQNVLVLVAFHLTPKLGIPSVKLGTATITPPPNKKNPKQNKTHNQEKKKNNSINIV